MNSQRKAQVKIWGAFLIVFALGGVTGASLDGIYRSRSNTTQGNQTAAVSIRDTDAYFETLKRELTLNDEQASSMRAILDRTRDDYKAVCADVRPRYDVVRERARGQMRALLAADQQERFDTIVTQEDCRCPEPKK
ncbi:MAG: hypothetical protein AABN34_22400 [Acidobacteriota bacterium]